MGDQVSQFLRAEDVIGADIEGSGGFLDYRRGISPAEISGMDRLHGNALGERQGRKFAVFEGLDRDGLAQEITLDR